MDNESKAPLKALCRGNRTDRGWTETPEGNWVPSVFDRRRLGVSHLQLVAEANNLPGIPGPAVASVLGMHATGPFDHEALLANFTEWMRATGS